MADQNTVQDPRVALAARVAGLKMPAALPTAPGMGADATGPLQTPQFAAPNSYAYQPGQAPMLAPGILPPSNPVQNPMDIANIVGQVSNLPAYQGPYQALENLRGQEQRVADSMAADRPPTMLYHPHYQPITGHGFWGGVKNFFGDVGKGALEGLSATGPGKAVYGMPRVEDYELRQQQRAEQIKALREQEGIPTEELRGVTGLAQAGGMAAWRGGELENQAERNRIMKQRADTQAQSVANRYAQGGVRLQQGWARLKGQEQDRAIRQWFEGGLLQAYNARIAAGEDENQARIDAQQDMRSATSQNQWSIQHPLLSGVLGAMGMGPDLQAAPGAQTKSAKPAQNNPPPNRHQNRNNRGSRPPGW